MSEALAKDPLLARIKAELVVMYGERLDRVVLFGSRARGDATEESDYDVAVFLRGIGRTELWPERHRLADLSYRYLMEQDADLQLLPFPVGAEMERTLFMHELRKDGVEL